MSDTASATTPLDIDSLRDRLGEVEIVDVRSPGEFETVRIEGSRNLPVDRLSHRVDEVRDLVNGGREVVLICRTQNRSAQAQAVLQEAGIGAVPIVLGGVSAWEQAGHPVVRESQRWDLERQIRLVAGSIVLLSILVSVVYPPARFVAGFVGAGLVFAAVTNTCLLGMALMKLPYNRPRKR